MRESIRQFLSIVALSIGAAVLYGVIHDQITARLCIEYFTVAHPTIVASDSPTIQGLVWGVVATWWVGFLLGVPLATVARTGKFPPWDTRQLLRPIALLLIVMGVCAALSGLVAFYLAAQGQLTLKSDWAALIPAAHHGHFVAAAWAHNTSYGVGFLGGAVLILHVWNARCGRALRAGLG